MVTLTLRRDECTAVPRFPLRSGFSEKPETLAVSRPLPDSFPERFSSYSAGIFTQALVNIAIVPGSYVASF